MSLPRQLLQLGPRQSRGSVHAGAFASCEDLSRFQSSEQGQSRLFLFGCRFCDRLSICAFSFANLVGASRALQYKCVFVFNSPFDHFASFKVKCLCECSWKVHLPLIALVSGDKLNCRWIANLTSPKSMDIHRL